MNVLETTLATTLVAVTRDPAFDSLSADTQRRLTESLEDFKRESTRALRVALASLDTVVGLLG